MQLKVDASLTIGQLQILDRVRFNLRSGEFCALIGPSGAGKSSLFKVLLGIREPTQGSVKLAQPDADHSSEKGALDAPPIGYVPQSDALHTGLKVEDSMAFAARLRMPDTPLEEAAKRISRTLADVGLAHRKDTRINKLSGGERKRVAVAMELLTQPPVLILDEPTSGLDPRLEAQMMTLFKDLSDKGHMLIVSTHSMQSLDMADHVLVLAKGKVVWFGPPKAMKKHFDVDRHEDIFGRLHASPISSWAARYAQNPISDRLRRRPAASPT